MAAALERPKDRLRNPVSSQGIVMSKNVDINYIARIAGVSRSTVSRVLTNHKNVKHETAQKVREAMLHCNYKPNVMARGLVTGKMNIVALVVSDITSPFYAELVAAITANLRDKGYLVSLYNFGLDCQNQDEHLRTLLEYGFAGIIIADARNEPSFGSILKSSRCPVVLLNRYIETVVDYDSIMNDNFLGGYIATKHLLELGHRSIAMLTGPQKSTSSIDRHRGYVQALSEFGITPAKNLVAEGDLRYSSGYGFVSMLFSDNEKRCSAIFSGNDMMAVGIMSRCREIGVRIPEDISLVGFDDIPIASASIIGLTTVQQPYSQMGQLAADQIDARIRGDDSARQRITLVPRLIIRNTTEQYVPSGFSGPAFPARQ